MSHIDARVCSSPHHTQVYTQRRGKREEGEYVGQEGALTTMFVFLLILQGHVKHAATALKAQVKDAELQAAALTTFLGSPGADPAAVIGALARFAQSWDQALANVRRWDEANTAVKAAGS